MKNSIGNYQISCIQILKGNQQYQLLNMKIAIKSNQAIKIYKGQYTFQALTQFIKKEFDLSNNQYTLTYQDEEGDNITLASNQDLKSAQELFSQKHLLKAKITLIPQEEMKPSTFQIVEPSPIAEEKVQEIKEIKEQTPKEEEPFKKWHKWAHWGHWGHPEHKGHWKHWGHKRGNHVSSSESSTEKHHGKGGFKRFHKIIDEVIAGKVDERIKALLPCLAAQLNGTNPIKTSVDNTVVHPNIDCKSCLATPITGIRYKCLTCPSFNLCENCEKTIQHEHNLLKMKKPEEENSDCELPFKFLKKMWKHHKKDRSCSSSKDKCGGGKITRKLAKIFGGKPQDYVEFTESNKALGKFEMIGKYATQNGLTEKLINFRCEKIASRLNRQPQEFKKVVEENLNLKPREIIKKLVENGEVSAPWSKCKGEERKCKKSNEGKHKRHEKDSCERKFQCPRNKFPTMLASGASERTDKAKILETLVSLFGHTNTKQYYDLIESHFSMGQEAIVNKWLQLQASV